MKLGTAMLAPRGIEGFSRWFPVLLLVLFLAGCGAKPIAYNQIAITIDLCPSSKPYEAKLFKALEALRVPIAVAISGGWIKEHPAELAEIKKLNLNITWVNHSFTHPVENDFLNNPKVDLKREVLANIELMKKNGLAPSKYFRFPGLRHNQARLKQLSALGYINLDANAWLDKGEKIKNGSIVLIHGNGNEQPGIVDGFIAWLKQNKKYRIVPLSDFMPAVSPPGTTEAVQP